MTPARVFPAPDLLEQSLHLAPRLFGDDPGTARVVAVFGRVAHRVAHVAQAALIDQIDDQFQLVEAFEIGNLRLVAGSDQGLEAGLDQRAHPTAQDRLLAKQIRLGFLGEGRLDHPGACDADAFRVRQRGGLGAAGRVLVDGEQRGRATAFDEELANAVTGRLGRDHRDVDIGANLNRAEADVEPVREQEQLAGRQIRLDGAAIHVGLRRVRHEHHDDVGPRGDVGR